MEWKALCSNSVPPGSQIPLSTHWRRSAHRDSRPWRYRSSTKMAGAPLQEARHNPAADSRNKWAPDTNTKNRAQPTTSHSGHHASHGPNDRADPIPGGHQPMVSPSHLSPSPSLPKGPHQEWTYAVSTFSSSHNVLSAIRNVTIAGSIADPAKHLGQSALLPRGARRNFQLFNRWLRIFPLEALRPACAPLGFIGTIINSRSIPRKALIALCYGFVSFARTRDLIKIKLLSR